MNKKNLINGKLFELNEWLTVPEAAQRLSGSSKEEVSEADVLRFALGGHLKLSVRFIKGARGIRGEKCQLDELKSGEMKGGKTFYFKEECPNEEPKYSGISFYDGQMFENLPTICDLIMAGSGGIAVESELQRLYGGPGVRNTFSPVFVEGPEEEVYLLLKEEGYNCPSEEEFQEYKDALAEVGAEPLSDNPLDHRRPNWLAADNLPPDSVLVVRPSALLDFQRRYSKEHPELLSEDLTPDPSSPIPLAPGERILEGDKAIAVYAERSVDHIRKRWRKDKSWWWTGPTGSPTTTTKRVDERWRLRKKDDDAK